MAKKEAEDLNTEKVYFKVPKKRLKGFDKRCRGRTRAVVLRKLMLMYETGETLIDWDGSMDTPEDFTHI